MSDENKWYEFRVTTYDTVKALKLTPTPMGILAENLLAKWGMVAATEDGEDSAGRQKMRLQTPEELAVRACDAADAIFAEFERRGWLIDVPMPAGKDKA